jgi:hypothetical protein
MRKNISEQIKIITFFSNKHVQNDWTLTYQIQINLGTVVWWESYCFCEISQLPWYKNTKILFHPVH